MNFYICKPLSHEIHQELLDIIKKLDRNAVIVDTLDEANICVFQNGWTKSKKCIEIYEYCKNNNIEYYEECMYESMKYNIRKIVK